ncbi:MAG: methyl-accepting chemotaxis protein [bacterium]
MTKKAFLLKLVFIVFVVTLIGAVSIQLLIYFVKRPSLEEAVLIITVPALHEVLITLLYLGAAFLYVRPVLAFLDRADSEEWDEERLGRVRSRASNTPYFLAVLSFFAFVAGSTIITLLSLPRLGWPISTLYYGVLGGMIAGLLAVPVYSYFSTWLTAPVIMKTLEVSGADAVSRLSGFRVSIRLKLVLTVVTLVGAATGYVATVGYAHSGEGIGWQFFLVTWIVCVLLSVLLAMAASGEFQKPVRKLMNTALRARQGDFGRSALVISNDEFAEMGAAMDLMIKTITGQFREIQDMAGSLQEGVKQVTETFQKILKVSSDLATGAAQQSSAVHQSSATANQIASSAKSISERAEVVNQAADSTLEACRDGEQKLDQAKDGFQEIVRQVNSIKDAAENLESRFQETIKVVKLVQEISEQTELLSLNASLEAAGAGQAGKRFAVVAESTRRLANQSAEASARIKDMLESIREATRESTEKARQGTLQVEQGNQAILEAGRSIQSISSLAKETSESTGEIASSTHQQTTASEQMAQSISEIEKVAASIESGAQTIDQAIKDIQRYTRDLSVRYGRKETGDLPASG